jgi:hypothetical protein
MGASKSAKTYLISDPHLSTDDAGRRACGALPDIRAVGGWRDVVGAGSCGAGNLRTSRLRLAHEVAPGMQCVRSWPSVHIANDAIDPGKG